MPSDRDPSRIGLPTGKFAHFRKEDLPQKKDPFFEVYTYSCDCGPMCNSSHVCRRANRRVAAARTRSCERWLDIEWVARIECPWDRDRTSSGCLVDEHTKVQTRIRMCLIYFRMNRQTPFPLFPATDAARTGDIPRLAQARSNNRTPVLGNIYIYTILI